MKNNNQMQLPENRGGGGGRLQESEWVEVFRCFKPRQKSFILLSCLRQEKQYHFSDLLLLLNN